MATQKEVVYPSTASFNAAGQLNFGPYPSGVISKLLRAEVRGQINFQAVTVGAASVDANFQLFGLQWVAHGAAALNVVSSADDDHWLIREQTGTNDARIFWTPAANTISRMRSYVTKADWAGQLPIGVSADLYLSFNSPTGVVIDNMNYFGTIRWWWT